jgi:hypothetical protein
MDDQVAALLVPSKSPTTMDEVDQSKPSLDVDPEPEGNPVGELNDLCLKIKRLPPEYEDIETEGKPHESVHIVKCKLGSLFTEQGRGRTKKHAKKVAAFKVRQRLTEMTMQSAGILTEEQESSTDGCIIEKLQSLTMGSKTTKIKDTVKLTEWIAEFRERSGEKLTSSLQV